MDPRLQKNQMQMLLSKRNVISDNELYEMLRSRQVFQVQIELRKDLERTLKALKNAEKTNVANVMTEKAMFLKRVGRRDRNRRYLTDVSSVTQTMESLDLKSNDVTDTDTARGQRGATMQNGAVETEQNAVNDQVPNSDRSITSNSSSKQNANVDSDTGKTVVEEDKEEFYILQSPNREWMDKIKEMPPRKCPTSTKVYTKSFKRSPSSKALKRESHADDSENLYREDNENECTEQKDESCGLSNARQNSDLKHHVSFAFINETDRRGNQSSQQDNFLAPLIQQGETLDCKTRHRRACNHKDSVECSQAETTNRKALLKLTGASGEDKANPPPRFLLTEATIDREMPAQARPNPSRQHDFDRMNNSSMRESNKPRNPARRPYFRRVSSPYTAMFKSGLSMLNLSAKRRRGNSLMMPTETQFERERTVDMLYVEETPTDPQSLGISQFDVEALMAFRRTRRGYSKTLCVKELTGHANDEEGEENKGKSKDRKSRARLKKAVHELQRPKSFREKSLEWYMGFLKARRNRKKKSKTDQAPMNRFKALPKIILQGGSDGAHKGNQNDNPQPRPSPLLVTNESTEVKLQRLKEHSKELQEKVDTFSAT